MKVLEGPLPPDILFNDDDQLPFEDTDNVGHLELRRATSATTAASSQKVSVCYDNNTFNVYTHEWLN